MIDASGKNDKGYGINHNAAFAQGLLENLTLALHPRALLAPQSGALRISAYRDFLPIHTIHPTYSFRAFKPFYGDLRQ